MPTTGEHSPSQETTSFEGDTEVDSVLNVGSATALSAQSKLKVNNGGMVKLNGFDSTVAGLEGNGTIQGSAALTAGDENDATFSGILQDGTGAGGLSLMKKGSGKMTLSGANTFSGNTTLDEGSLEVKNAQALGTGSLSQTDGSSTLIFDTTGTVTNDLSIFSVEFLQDVILSGNIIANNAEYNVADGVTAEASGDITGTGGTTKLGLGTQVLSGNNTYTGANDVQAGTLRAGSTTAFGDNVATTVDSGAVLELDGNNNSIGSLAGAGTVENANATAATLTTGGDNTSTTFSGLVQDGTGGGALSLTKTGTGTQTLTGANTYSGGTTIDGGTLSLGSGASQDALGSGAVTVNSGGSLKLWINPGGSYTIDNAFTLDGGRVYSQDGQYNLTGAMTLNAGGGTLGGTWQNKYLQVSGVISGTGGLTVEDSDNASQVADVILSGVNTYTGNTVIGNNVALQITGAGKLGSGSYAGAIANSGTLNYNSSANQTLSGVISGTGALQKNNSGTLTLRSTVANTYSGGTTINDGIVSLGTGGGVTSDQDALGTGSVSVNSGGELRLWISNTGSYTIDNAFTLNGGTVHGEDGIYDLSGAMTLAAGGGTLSGKWSGKGITVSGTISGTGALTIDEKAGGNGGEVILTANNNFTGGTTVDGGTLKLTGSGRIGNGGLTVNNGGTLSVATNAFNSLGGAITLNEGGTLSTDSTGQNAHNIIDAIAINGGTLTSSGNSYSEGNWIFNDDVTVGGSALSTISGLAVGSKGGGGIFNVADSVSGAGTDLLVTAAMVDAIGGSLLTKTGAGTMTLSSNNSYTGTTTINQGTLELASSKLSFQNIVIIDGATDGTATMLLTGSGANSNNMLSDAAVTIQNGGTIDDATTDANVQSMGTITFNNGGTMSSSDVSPNGTYGNYFIKGGVIVTGNAAATINATELSMQGTQTFNVADVTGNASSDLTISSEINEYGGGGLTKTGTGTLTLTAQNTYTGGTTVNDGTLDLVGQGIIDGALTVDGSSSLVKLSATGNNGMDPLDSLTLSNGGTFTDNGPAGGLHSVNNSVTFDGGGTISSEVTGNGGFGNFLFIQGINVTGTPGLATIDADSISFNFSQTLNVEDSVAGSGTDLLISSSIRNERVGTITKNGTGKVTLSGSNVDTSAWAINAGTLEIGGSGVLQSGSYAGAIANSGTFEYNSTAVQTMSGVISGTGALVKDNTGTLTLSGANTYSGGTTVDNGTLALTRSGSAGTIRGDLTINANGVVDAGSNWALGYGAGESVDTININGGELRFSANAGAGGTAASTITMTGGTIAGNGGGNTFDWYYGNTTTPTLQTIASGDLSTISANMNLRLNGDANALTFDVADGTTGDGVDLLVSGNITKAGGDGGGRIIKTGAGTMTLTGANTYTGTTTVDGGTLVLTASSNFYNYASSQFNINNGSTLKVGNTLFFQNDTFVFGSTGGGTLEIGAGNNVFRGDNTFTTLGGSQNAITGTNLNSDGGGTRTFNVSNGTDDVDLLISAQISNNASIAKTGAGTMELTGANTYSGGTTLNTGTLVLGSATAAGTGTITQTDEDSILRLNTGGTIANDISLFNLESLQSVTLSGAITANNATYDIASGTTTTISGDISGGGGTIKEGLGTLVLSGTNTYTGNTEINAGTLSLSSSTSNNNIDDSVSIIVGADGTFDVSAITASGGFQLANGQTLAGTGDVIGATEMTAGSNLSAGDGGVGELSFLTSLDVASASTGSLLFDLGSAGTGDLIDVTGQLNIGNGLLDLDDFVFTNLGATSVTGTYTWNLFQANTFDFANLGTNTTDNIFGSYSATLAISGGNVVQLTMFVPEPSSTALLGLGGLMLALRRKRSAA